MSPQIARNGDATRLFERIRISCPEIGADDLRQQLNTVLLTERRLMRREIQAQLPNAVQWHAPSGKRLQDEALNAGKVISAIGRASRQTGME